MLHKPQKIVSKAIRQSARGEPCLIKTNKCNNDWRTTVFCHLNSPFKGTGNKSPDLLGVYGCSDCHVELDSGRVSDTDILRALKRTLIILYRKGLIKI